MKYLIPIISFFIIPFIYGQEAPVEKGLKAITSDAIKAQVGFIASDWTGGRKAGERGEYLAGDYIASMLQVYGVKPGGDYLRGEDFLNTLLPGGRSYFQNFVVIRTIADNKPELKLISRTGQVIETSTLTNNIDYSAKPLYRSVEIDAPVVFVGYGFKNEKIKYNDFSKLEVKDKFILKLSGYPEFADKKLTPSEINTSTGTLESYLKEMGAVGILEFDPSATITGNPPLKDFMNLSPSEHTEESSSPLPKYSLPGKTTSSELIRLTISAKAANEILSGTGISISEYIRLMDSNQSAQIPVLTGKSISFKSEATTSQFAVRNIIGVVEGKDPEQIIVVGAHYDHVGMKSGYIWNGADDNASGTVGALTLAKALMATGEKPEKTIIIALWSSEEIGLLGSRYFVRNTGYPVKNIRLNLNLDMISRYISEENIKGVYMTYTGSFPHFKELTEANIRKYEIDLTVNYQPSDNQVGGSDHKSFVDAGIPVMRFKPGHREEYHTPADEASTLDWDIMEKIIRISFVNIWELANSDW